MALDSTHYLTLPEARWRAGVDDSEEDDALAAAVMSACRALDVWCGQFFYKLETATARTFRPLEAVQVFIDPFWTTTGLVIETDGDDDGSFAREWTSSDYELHRFGGSMADMLGAPFDEITAVGDLTFPTLGRRRATVRVTAQWGWVAVPQNVTEAAKILTLDLFKRKDAAFGIATGTVDFGGLRIGRDVMAQVASLLTTFRRFDRKLGSA